MGARHAALRCNCMGSFMCPKWGDDLHRQMGAGRAASAVRCSCMRSCYVFKHYKGLDGWMGACHVAGCACYGTPLHVLLFGVDQL